MSDQRRVAPRKRVGLLLRLKYRTLDHFVEAYATNVSEKGIFLRLKSPPAVGTEVRFDIRLADDSPALKGVAVVRWSRTADGLEGPAGAGLEFQSLDEATRRLVSRMVSSKAPQAPPSAPPVVTKPRAPAPSRGEDEPLTLANPPPTPADSVDVPLEGLFDGLLDGATSTPTAAPKPPQVRSMVLDRQGGPGAGAALELDDGKHSDASLGQGKGADVHVDFGDAGAPSNVDSGSEPNGPIELDPGEDADAPLELDDGKDRGPAARSVPPRAKPVEPPRPPPALSAPAAASTPVAKVALKAKTAFLDEPPAKAEGPAVGIDLGTTNSCVAVLINGKPTVLRSREGNAIVPSVVHLTSSGRLLVGARAKDQQLLNPARTIYGAKRLVGRAFDSPIVREMRQRFLYDICADGSGKAAVRLGDTAVSLEEISGIVLRECRDLAAERLGRPVHRAVVTVPAYYSEPQREAVRRAGQLAGLRVERILNEPTAAALAFGLNRQLEKKVLVYDLGGGTFDATLLRISGNTFEVLATGGDTFLGGTDFDNAVVDLLLERFAEQHQVPFQADRVALSRVLDAAERAKIALSQAQEAQVDVPMLMMYGDRPLGLRCVLKRPELEQVVGHLVDRTLEVVQDVLLDAKVKPKDLDDIVLVGGQSRMPLVRARVAQVLKKAPFAGVSADEAVALGAALLAGTVDRASNIVLVDVLPVTMGIGVPGGKFQRLLPRNTPLPAQAEFSTQATAAEDGTVEVHLFQGEDPRIAANEYVGTVLASGLSPKKKCRLELVLRLSPECVLHAEARQADGAALTVNVNMTLSREQLLQRLEVASAAAKAAEADQLGKLPSRAARFWSYLKGALGGA